MIRRLLPVTLALAFAGAAHAIPPDPNCSTASSSFEVIQRGIFDRHDCNMGYCHGADRQAGLDLRPGNSYASLLRSDGEADQAPDDSGELKLVDPGHPEESLLWVALARKTLRLRDTRAPIMPKDGLPLSREELEGVRLWILAGASETAVVRRVADLIDACPKPSAQDEEDEYVADLPTCDPDDPSLLLPNLIADPPFEVRVRMYSWGRRLEFGTNVGNTGDGPLIIQAATPPAGPGSTVYAMQVILRADGSKCTHRAGTMRLSDRGDRWAVGNFADFELRKDDPITGEVLAASSKAAFCLVDAEPIRGAGGGPHQYELHCTDPIGRMGISVGYKDVYSRIAPGQWIDLDTDPDTTIERGIYYLVNIADPSSHLLEKDDYRADNLNYLRIQLNAPDPDELQPPPKPSPRPEPTVQPTQPIRYRSPMPTRTARLTRPPHSRPTPAAAPRPRHPDRPAHPTTLRHPLR